MAVRTREELISTLNAVIGDRVDDETITLLEDITDTFTDLEDKSKNNTEDWKEKYEKNDAEWRKKYTERFFSKEPEPEPEPEPEKVSFESLFDE